MAYEPAAVGRLALEAFDDEKVIRNLEEVEFHATRCVELQLAGLDHLDESLSALGGQELGSKVILGLHAGYENVAQLDEIRGVVRR